MKTTSKNSGRRPVRNIGSVYRTRRDLLRITVGPEVLGECQLPIELVDILVDLYGATHLNWTDPKAYFGYVTFRDLLESAVHDDTFSDATLSLRLRRLQDKELLVVKTIRQTGAAAELRSGPRASRSWVRITPAGVKIAAAIWERYEQWSERLLEGVPTADLETHYRVNAIISRRTITPSVSYEQLVRDLAQERRI